MLALGIDTSSGAGSVGLADEGRLLAELSIRGAKTHSERLLPSIQALLASVGVRPHAVDLFAVSSGPGSFTGLRIGMATAKGLALAVGRPLVGFSTLETVALAIAQGLPSGPDRPAVCVMLDAGRGEVYRGVFHCDAGKVEPLAVEAALAPDLAAQGLPEPCLLAGDGVAALRGRLAARLGPRRLIVESTPFIGSTLARRALVLAGERGPDRLPPLIPNYLRPSDAEMTFRG